MNSKVTFFPVGNGDQTLIKLPDKKTILVDCNIRQLSEDDSNDHCDVAMELRSRLERDSEGRHFVNAFLQTHPDQDHCSGIRKHFHLGSLDEYNDDPPEDEEAKIVIREIWSSPMVFRRADKNLTLCDNAKAFNKEAKRRVNLFKKDGAAEDGDRILILGEDENGNTDELEEIFVRVDEQFSSICGEASGYAEMRLLGPLPIQDDEEKEDLLAKNRSSVIIQFSIKPSKWSASVSQVLIGGDAEVVVWESLNDRHANRMEWLSYDLMLAPHHCSWHSLSHDSWSKCDNPKASEAAKSALGQANSGAVIVSSSNPIKDDKSDPPCFGAKQEYKKILTPKNGQFYCTGEHPTESKPEPLEFNLTALGVQKAARTAKGKASAAGTAVASEARPHG